MKMNAPDAVRDAYKKKFGKAPEVLAVAPGRVNLIGDHTDYNDGFVMPLALEKQTAIAGGLVGKIGGGDKKETLHCTTLNPQRQQTSEAFITPNTPPPAPGKTQWADYVAGVYNKLRAARGPLAAAQLVIKSDVPIGAGLSSSAALELSVLRCLCELNNIAWRPAEMAKLAQKAECEWAGMNCGIMDQLIAAVARRGCAVLLDCRSLAATPVPLPANLAVVVMDTATRRQLAHSDYNLRRAQCEEAARAAGVASLRDLTFAGLTAAKNKMDKVIFRRARHVVGENMRVLKFRDALGRDAAEAGALLTESHKSLADDYEVSNDALNAAAEVAAAHPACFGARMTGAGFGGCIVALVDADAAALADFTKSTAARYQAKTNKTPALYPTKGGGPAALLAP